MKHTINMVPPLKAWPVWGIRIIRNVLQDVRFGGLLGGMIKTQYRHFGAYNTVNSDYAQLSFIFKDRIRDADVLVDVGCGKGRVINYWLRHAPHNRLIGIELDEEIANQTRQRLRKHENVTILAGDAGTNIPADGTLFYLYNPFDGHVMETFKKGLMSVFCKDNDITVLYSNPKHVDVFLDDPEWTVNIEKVGGPSTLPFDPLAVITMSGSPLTSPGWTADPHLSD